MKQAVRLAGELRRISLDHDLYDDAQTDAAAEHLHARGVVILDEEEMTRALFKEFYSTGDETDYHAHAVAIIDHLKHQ